MAFPQPIKPDFMHCGEFFADPAPPIYHDCLTAWNNLPTGANPVRYRSTARRHEPKSLLLTQTAGTCQLKFFASGKYVEEYPFFINIVPDDIKDMLGLLLDGCVFKADQGGIVTKNIDHSIDWITNIDNVFPPEPADHFFLPSTMTFLTAMVWNTEDDIQELSGFEPGANSFYCGEAIYRGIEDAWNKAEDEEGSESARALELGRRADFVSDAYANMGHGPPWWTWWGARRPDLQLGNVTTLLSNLTLSAIRNISEVTTARRRSIARESRPNIHVA